MSCIPNLVISFHTEEIFSTTHNFIRSYQIGTPLSRYMFVKESLNSTGLLYLHILVEEIAWVCDLQRVCISYGEL